MNAPQFQRAPRHSTVPVARRLEHGLPKRAPEPVTRLLDHLVSTGRISDAERLHAGHIARVHMLSIPEVLVAEGWLDAEELIAARSECFGATRIRLDLTPPDPTLLEELEPRWCLRHRLLPWRRIGERIVWVTSIPEHFDQAKDELPIGSGPPILAIASPSDIDQALAYGYANTLLTSAETSLSDQDSCRTWSVPHRLSVLLLCAVSLLLLAAVPGVVMASLLALAIAVVFVNVVLKTVLTVAALRKAPLSATQLPPMPLPRISVLVPLLRESQVAAKLLNNLEQLQYPRGLREVLFVVEAEDDVTKSALSHLRLPYGFRVIDVPKGSVKTKPRALNYALQFCHGDIIGVFDAEDKPDPKQLLKVAEGFQKATTEVACLQGRLDFFNTRAGLLTRCFTAEYAGWFGLQLRGLARLGLPVPLGGTTLFIRRDVLEHVGQWDAHNVTEDADLGLRLHRAGYRTSLIDTVTEEEATNTAWRWVRQRSRWIKGYILTYAVHMRRPRALWQDLGPTGFLAFQALFLGSVLGALTMPVLLVMIAALFGLPIPGVSEAFLRSIGVAMLGLEFANLAVWIAGIRAKRHRHLLWIVPLLHLYFLLASLAAFKAIGELTARPFFWDKTCHGLSSEDRNS